MAADCCVDNVIIVAASDLVAVHLVTFLCYVLAAAALHVSNGCVLLAWVRGDGAGEIWQARRACFLFGSIAYLLRLTG